MPAVGGMGYEKAASKLKSGGLDACHSRGQGESHGFFHTHVQGSVDTASQ